jgi:hypothetical protein
VVMVPFEIGVAEAAVLFSAVGPAQRRGDAGVVVLDAHALARRVLAASIATPQRLMTRSSGAVNSNDSSPSQRITLSSQAGIGLKSGQTPRTADEDTLCPDRLICEA